ncbi:MAG: AgmX/PglI C-terminal domain-containing protein [bacterium]
MKSKLPFFFAVIFFISFFFSCAGNSSIKSKGREESDSEVGIATMKGGETVSVNGYSEDREMSRKIRELDLEIIDCYKQFTPIGRVSAMTINYTMTIDESGFIEQVAYKKGDSTYNKIAECIAKDLEELPFRPGELREVNCHLAFKPLRDRKKAVPDDKRSKMILSLSEMQKFKTCYEEAAAKNRRLEGSFSIKFVVTEDGKAEGMKILNNTFPNSNVPLCVVKKLSDTIFPEGDSEDLVEVHFKYEAENSQKKRKPMDIEM